MDDKILREKAKLVRKWSLIATTEAGSGHPTSCLSAADITTVLFDQFFTYDIKNPQNPNNDRFILSKGHAAPLLYTLYAIAGAIPKEDLKSLRKFGSPLEGHPMPAFPYYEVATGSLGQGLSAGAGMALIAKKEKRPGTTYVLLGDGECAEGSVWEAANFSSYYKLNNLVAIVDVNGLGQSQDTMFGHDTKEYVDRFTAFGWETIEIDGHNLSEIKVALEKASKRFVDKPFAIIARTEKGKGISFLEAKEGWHGKALKKEDLSQALLELGDVDETLGFKLRSPQKSNVILNEVKKLDSSVTPQNDNYKMGEEIATREVYGSVLAQLGKNNPGIYALDGDVKNSTFSQDFMKEHPDRFVECFIAEQNMVGVALGMSKLGKIPFVSTFASFLTRAFDQIRMARISEANIKFVGSHAGVSIGEDGASQMGLEDISLFATLPDVIVFHPSDAVSMARILPIVASHKGISYIRTLRPKTPVIYKENENFEIGGSKILRQSEKDILTVVAVGITVFEALEAYEILKKEDILIRVIDCYCIKPIDKKTLLSSVQETKQKLVITVEDHFSHGGLGDLVLDALSSSGAMVHKMAIDEISHSGKMDELLDFGKISASHIVKRIKSLI